MACLPLIAALTSVLSANPYLDQGRKLYDAVQYEEAEAKLRLAKEVPTSSREERREAFDLLARSVSAQGRADEAERLYAELLTVDPNTPSPANASPKIRALFTRAKERVYPKDFVKLTALPAVPGRVEVELADPWRRVNRLELFQARGEAPFEALALPLVEWRSSADLPEPPAGSSVRWYVEARANSGELVAQLGSADKPHAYAASLDPSTPSSPGAQSTTLATPSESPPRWVAWTVGGVSLAAVVAGVVLFVSADQDYRAAQAAPFASDARTLERRYKEKSIGGAATLGAGVVGGATSGILLWRWQ